MLVRINYIDIFKSVPVLYSKYVVASNMVYISHITHCTFTSFYIYHTRVCYVPRCRMCITYCQIYGYVMCWFAYILCILDPCWCAVINFQWTQSVLFSVCQYLWPICIRAPFAVVVFGFSPSRSVILPVWLFCIGKMKKWNLW